jgi:universal stress protein F
MYKTILVPVDLAHPEHAGEICALARAVAAKGARIVMLHVLETIPGYVAAELPSDLLDKRQSEAKAKLMALAKKAGAEAVLRDGHASTEIMEYGREIGADLIVIASHRPGLQDYLLGSTAARVVRHAPCAVLVHR